MPEPLQTSSFQLPAGETIEVVMVRLPNGKIVPRRPDELVPRPTPPQALDVCNAKELGTMRVRQQLAMTRIVGRG